jgi:hypothetical protein
MTGNEDPDNEHTASGTTSGVCTIGTNQNIVSAARQYAERKRLRGDQVTALEVFLNVSSALSALSFVSWLWLMTLFKEPPSLREAKMLTDLWALGNQVEKIVTSKPAFEVSEDCKVISCYSISCLTECVDKYPQARAGCPVVQQNQCLQGRRYHAYSDRMCSIFRIP